MEYYKCYYPNDLDFKKFDYFYALHKIAVDHVGINKDTIKHILPCGGYVISEASGFGKSSDVDEFTVNCKCGECKKLNKGAENEKII